ncbi:hypothetical protein ETB97_012717 [Aspergillus alliaceus]|uniref:Uncharacterized protein n=1 Tax=Petromyces alliaceus TaxID=209559 RepID=A0A8H6E875_PETAA|nr:hypothetical protein ETB97_012717 [Aspergillus burnettii]
MLTSIDYQALRDFSGLPCIHQTCVSSDIGFNLENLPPLAQDVLRQLQVVPAGTQVLKKDSVKPTPASATAIATVMAYMHTLSHEVFKNLSQVLELPWEKYLGEMHEFTMTRQNELRILRANAPIPNSWSTLTIIVNIASPYTATVLYGNALRVFSEGTIASLDQPTVDPTLLPDDSTIAGGNWIVYYVRPNDDVYYTRTAGALMTPLTCEDYASRKRVRDIIFLT